MPEINRPEHVHKLLYASAVGSCSMNGVCGRAFSHTADFFVPYDPNNDQSILLALEPSGCMTAETETSPQVGIIIESKYRGETFHRLFITEQRHLIAIQCNLGTVGRNKSDDFIVIFRF